MLTSPDFSSIKNQRGEAGNSNSLRSGHLDEIGPADHGVLTDAEDPEHNDVRHYALWGNLLAGGAGVEWYFGYKHPHADLNLEDFRSRNKL
jgi:hypothetical protein